MLKHMLEFLLNKYVTYENWLIGNDLKKQPLLNKLPEDDISFHEIYNTLVAYGLKPKNFDIVTPHISLETDLFYLCITGKTYQELAPEDINATLDKILVINPLLANGANLASMYQGNISKTQYADVFTILSLQILKGDETHLSLLSKLFDTPEFIEASLKDDSLSEKVYAIAAYCEIDCIKTNNPYAMFLRGSMYHYGVGASNHDLAIYYYEQGIAIGQASAMNNRAYMYHTGEGGPVNFEKAIIFYERAIAQDNTDAMNNRARMYINGEGGSVDYDKAILLYERAIAKDDANSMYKRALMHFFGQGGPVNFAQASLLYDRAIVKGMGLAMLCRACMYQFGLGGPINLCKAIIFYEKAFRIEPEQQKLIYENLNIITLDKSLAEDLLASIWEELLEGLSFTDKTISALATHCLTEISQKIKNSSLGTSLKFLKKLKQTPDHPIRLILNTEQEGVNPFEELMKKAYYIQEVRVNFFAGKSNLGDLPDDVKRHILTYEQPGIALD